MSNEYLGGKKKLGQRQSQTPISSAFWVLKDFGLKKVLGPKRFSSKKILGPKKMLLQKWFLVQQNLGSKILSSNKFWVKKNFRPKFFWLI